MTITTSVPAPTYGATGYVAPAESAILGGVQADMDAAFGGNLNPGLSTPQGQLAQSETAIIGAVNDAFLFLTSQFDPAYAVGRYQDALARIYFIERNPAQPTVAQCICTGLVGVAIPVGAKALAQDGNYYICTEAGTIGAGGTVTLPFACVVPGPIVCPEGSLNQIYTSIPGWDALANPADGVIGNDVESRAAFEQRRRLSVAKNAIGSLPAILGAVLGVANVLDAYVTENTSSTQAIIGGVTLAPNSVYVAVVGGAAADVARAIWTKKAPGCAYNGNTTVTVQDTNSGYAPPYPSYSVSFMIPAALPILFAVNIVNSVQVPANAPALIQAAIVAAAAGEDGGPRTRIGTTVYASRFYAAVAALGSWAQIIAIQIGTSTANADSVAVAINQVPAISAANIAVTLT